MDSHNYIELKSKGLFVSHQKVLKYSFNLIKAAVINRLVVNYLII